MTSCGPGIEADAVVEFITLSYDYAFYSVAYTEETKECFKEII